MRVVVALGGNALLRRGQPLTAENQRANARVACKALAPLALEHDLVISHGNGPQVGLLALQGSAYTAVEPYPFDMLGAQTEGMIGYLLQQELGNELPQEKRLASLLTLIEVDRGADIAELHRRLREEFGVGLEVRVEHVVPGDTVLLRGRVRAVADHGSPHRREPWAVIVTLDELEG